MALTLILGPVKSGKSLELISRIAPYEFADKKVLYLQPTKNVREDDIVSRSGLQVKARKIASLQDVRDDKADVIGIDETFMFDPEDTTVIKTWLHDGKEIILSSLDLNYRGRLVDVVIKLLELKPELIIYKKAVCEACKSYDAVYTQILEQNGSVVTDGLPTVTPEDGTYVYEPRCRDCFVAA